MKDWSGHFEEKWAIMLRSGQLVQKYDKDYQITRFCFKLLKEKPLDVIRAHATMNRNLAAISRRRTARHV